MSEGSSLPTSPACELSDSPTTCPPNTPSSTASHPINHPKILEEEEMASSLVHEITTSPSEPSASFSSSMSSTSTLCASSSSTLVSYSSSPVDSNSPSKEASPSCTRSTDEVDEGHNTPTSADSFTQEVHSSSLIKDETTTQEPDSNLEHSDQIEDNRYLNGIEKCCDSLPEVRTIESLNTQEIMSDVKQMTTDSVKIERTDVGVDLERAEDVKQEATVDVLIEGTGNGTLQEVSDNKQKVENDVNHVVENDVNHEVIDHVKNEVICNDKQTVDSDVKQEVTDEQKVDCDMKQEVVNGDVTQEVTVDDSGVRVKSGYVLVPILTPYYDPHGEWLFISVPLATFKIYCTS